MNLPMKINSKENQIVKDFIKLINDKKFRRESGIIICEGIKMFEEALLYAEIDMVFVSEDKMDYLKNIMPLETKVYVVADSIMKKMSFVKTPQGIIFSCTFKRENKPYKNCEQVMILDGLQDPGNVGTIIRTADAFSIDKIILGNNTVDFTSDKVVRSTMGAIFRADIEICDLEELILELKNDGFEVLGTALEKDSEIFQKSDVKMKKAVIIGNEGSGISQNILKLCDRKIILPISEHSESLNASVAASIIMWEMNKKAKV